MRKVAAPPAAEQIEKSLVTAILGGGLGVGASLPNERDLAARLGVTRPTLREVLKQLAKEGWLTIRHGKATLVTDYWREGGLGVLKTLAQYADALSPDLIGQLLEVRSLLLPPITVVACRREPEALLRRLARAEGLDDQAMAYAEFDWGLQTLMADCAGNPVCRLIINDFAAAYAVLANLYFQGEPHRRRSRAYYRELAAALRQGLPVEPLVRKVMLESAEAWRKLAGARGRGGGA
ncbi:hypothetical protein AAU61_20815 [Desulfocarbo indianensis]|nr:hypothetical protein AAU61_20815 [Desulfocarbo indianensis]